MPYLTRRHALQTIALAPLVRLRADTGPLFFTAAEFATMRRLAEAILPGATDAAAAEFIDLMCARAVSAGAQYRDGLAWFDNTMRARTGQSFADAPPTEVTRLMEEIAYRRNQTAANEAGMWFFWTCRGMVVDAYYTTAAGWAELGYQGNKVVAEFSVPDEAVRYALERSPA